MPLSIHIIWIRYVILRLRLRLSIKVYIMLGISVGVVNTCAMIERIVWTSFNLGIYMITHVFLVSVLWHITFHSRLIHHDIWLIVIVIKLTVSSIFLAIIRFIFLRILPELICVHLFISSIPFIDY